jgi:hypothetical protein
MSQYTADNIGVALFPTPLVLLNLPRINDISYKIQCVAGVVFEKVVELVCLTISCSEMHIRNKDRPVDFFWHALIYCDARKSL